MNQSKAEDEAADAAAETEIEKAEDETTGVAEEAAKATDYFYTKIKTMQIL